MTTRLILARLSLAIAALLASLVIGVFAQNRPYSVRNLATQIGPGHPRSVSWYATTYTYLGDEILWTTCGYATNTSGCYGSGTIGPFVRPCSIASSGNGVYVLDSNVPGEHPILYIYKQVASSTPSMTLLKQIELPALDGSNTAHCSLAALGSWVYAGHDESIYYSRVQLSDYSVHADTCGGPITSITTGPNAVMVFSNSHCEMLYDNKGALFLGGGAGTDDFVLNSTGHALP